MFHFTLSIFLISSYLSKIKTLNAYFIEWIQIIVLLGVEICPEGFGPLRQIQILNCSHLECMKLPCFAELMRPTFLSFWQFPMNVPNWQEYACSCISIRQRSLNWKSKSKITWKNNEEKPESPLASVAEVAKRNPKTG